MIIAIDGPAGAGKSTTARAVAKHFGFAYIDTGAMYRAVALATYEAGYHPTQDVEPIIDLARELPIDLRDNGQSTFIGERDVSGLIRTAEIGQLTSQISSIPAIREIVVEQQRRLAREGEHETGGAVLEGRDIQTVVFPDAEVKIFLTANARTRALRRHAEWCAKGETVEVEHTERELVARDERDSTRENSPLQAATDATLVATDNLTCEEVVEQIAQIVREKQLTANEFAAGKDYRLEPT
jgi:cytidylate kinase